MQSNQIFETENVIAIYDRSGGELHAVAGKKDQVGNWYEGICVAQSALWCRNMLQGKRDLLSKPDYALAAPLQAKYEIIYKNDYSKFLKSMGMTIAATDKLKGLAAVDLLTKNDGQYMLRYPGHAMGAKISGSNYYFFDPESGLFKYESGDAFTRRILRDYHNEMSEDWTLRRVTLPV